MQCGPPANLSLGYDFIASQNFRCIYLFSLRLQNTYVFKVERGHRADDTAYLITGFDLIVICTMWTNNVIFICTLLRFPLHLLLNVDREVT